MMESSSDHEIQSTGGGGGAVDAGSRRPMNAFLLFCKRHRGIVKEKYPNLENRNITKILGEWWQSLSEAEKSNFTVLASEYKEHVMREQPNFRWRRNPVAASVAAPGASKPVQNGVASAAAKSVKESAAVAVHSNSSSSSSSPEPSKNVAAVPSKPTHSGSSSSASSVVSTSSAPKPFKKRFLANIDPATLAATIVSPEAEHACKALLQLAGVRESSPTSAITAAGHNSNSGHVSCNGSRSGTASPPGGGESEKGGKQLGFRTLRDAVWSRVAKTLLKQEEEKGSHSSAGGDDDAPLNLSSQCTIRGQTIIEHIIENILDKPMPGSGDGDEQQVALNLNNNGVNGSTAAAAASHVASAAASSANSPSAEEIKERIFRGLKQDLLSKRSGEKRDSKEAASLWNLLPHIKLAQEQCKDPKGSKGEPTSEEAKMSIKHLLAQSPAPVSPRSKSNHSSKQSSSAVSPSGGCGVSVSVTLVNNSGGADGPVNLSTTPPQTPLSTSNVTITATTTTSSGHSPAKRKLLDDDDEEDEVRRSSRSCKGKRYQEFKDEGRLGRSKSGGSSERAASTRKPHKSGDSSVDKNSLGKSTNTPSAQSPPSPFDITTKLNAIPALSLDNYQHKVLKAKNGSPSDSASAVNNSFLSRNTRSANSSSSSSGVAGGGFGQNPQPQQRRRSSEHLESTPPKRKSRRTGAATSAKKEKESAAADVSCAVDVVVSS